MLRKDHIIAMILAKQGWVMARDPRRYAYSIQIMHARKRGIKMLFSFEEWCEWWEHHLGPNWMTKRGPKRGQYVMARNGDKGHYQIDNVRCILATDNIQEMKRRGGLYCRHKLTLAQVRQIRTAKYGTLTSLAKQFGIHKSTISNIRSGISWKHNLWK